MGTKVLNAAGLPVRKSVNLQGMVSVRLDEDCWEKLAHLKTLWEAEHRMPFSVGDVLRACLIQTYQRTLSVLEDAMKEPPADPVPAVESCGTCHGAETGSHYRCKFCSRSMGNDLVALDLYKAGDADALDSDGAVVEPAMVVKKVKARKSKKGA